MTYNPEKHHRRSIRLKGYDYSQLGFYFITICVQNREHLFGHIENGKMVLNDAGRMGENEWLNIPQRFKNVVLHEYIVMPNHFHCIVEMVETKPVGATLVVDPNKNGHPQGDAPTGSAPQGDAPTENSPTVGDIVGAFKSITTVNYISSVKDNDWKPFHNKLWQRNYYEHIIRNEQAYQNISQYIISNPKNWDNDTLKLNPSGRN